MRDHHYQKLSHVVHAAVHNLAFASLEIQKRAWDENLGGIAQLVERLLCKQDVRSSSLLASTFLPKAWRQVLAFLSAEGSVAQLVRAHA